MSKKNSLPKVKFPIELIEQSYGTDYLKTLKRGETVHCLRCGQPIIINSKSVFYFDDLPYVTCSNVIYRDDLRGIKKRCGYVAFASYYIEQKEKEALWSKNNATLLH